MQTLRGLVVGCAVLLLAGQTYGDAKDDAAKLLVGKWESKLNQNGKEITATLDFTKDGKFSIKITLGKENQTLDGTYKVLDEKTVELTVAREDKTRTEKQQFKVSKDTLELTGKDNKPQKFNRIK